MDSLQIKRSEQIFESYKDLQDFLKDQSKVVDTLNFKDGELIIFRYKSVDDVKSILGKCIVSDTNKLISLEIPYETIYSIENELESLKNKKTIHIEKYLRGFDVMTNRPFEFSSSDIRNYFFEGQMRMVNEKEQLTGVPTICRLYTANNYSFHFNVSGFDAMVGKKVLIFTPFVELDNKILQNEDITKNFPTNSEENYTLTTKNGEFKFKKLTSTDITRVYLKPFRGSNIEGKVYNTESGVYNGFVFEIPASLRYSNMSVVFEFSDEFLEKYSINGNVRLILSRFFICNCWDSSFIMNYESDLDYPDRGYAFNRYYLYTHVYSDGTHEDITYPYDTSKIEKLVNE